MNLFLDTDIGSDVDDALALALIEGSPELDLRGISTVYGNTRLRGQLARRYLRLANGDTSLPIAAGAEATRSGLEVWWAGHEGSLFHDLDAEPVDENGIELLRQTVANNPGLVDVLAIGPLTNIAAALDADPDFEKNVRRLVIMGGDFRGDRIAEHNFKSDVAAAQRVFSSAIPIIVGGLDLTLQVKIGPAEVDQIAQSGPLGEILAEEIRIWWKFNDQRGAHQWNSPHDPILALWLAKPELFIATRAHVGINDAGETREQLDAHGTIQILDTPNPDAVAAEIVRRIVAASRSAAANQPASA